MVEYKKKKKIEFEGSTLQRDIEARKGVSKNNPFQKHTRKKMVAVSPFEKTPINPDTGESWNKPILKTAEERGIEGQDSPVIYRDKEGNITATQLPDGRVFSGLTSSDIQKLAGAATQRAQAPAGTVEASELMNAPGFKATDPGVTRELEKAGAFEEVDVKDIQIDLKAGTEKLKDVPIGSPVLRAFVGTSQGRKEGTLPKSGWGALTSLANGFFKYYGVKDLKDIPAEDEEMIDLSVREAALQDITQRSYEKGISEGEVFGSMVESIPGIGDLANKWAGDLIEAPSDNADTVVANLEKYKEFAANSREKVGSGVMTPEDGLELARDMEEHSAELKGRLKLLIDTSPALQANTDEINRIQTAILEVDTKIGFFRESAEIAYANKLTGAKPMPSDVQIWREMQEDYYSK